jgi:hypothetical protein
MELSGCTTESDFILLPSHVSATHRTAAASPGTNTVNTKTKLAEEGANNGTRVIKF